MARLSSETCAELVWESLEAHPHATRARIAHHTGLTPSQVTRGMVWLSELFGTKTPIVKVWINKEWCYALALDDRDVREHRERWLRTEITRARHQLNWSQGVYEEHPTDENDYQLEQAKRRLYDLKHAHQRMFGDEAAA
jgi:hypothetical protein